MPIRFADHLKEIPEYIPGKPVEELERELGIQGAIKMASNENFSGPPPSVRQAISEKVKELNAYEGIRVVGGRITERFEEPVAGVTTRAVETIEHTLERVAGCLAVDGLVILMKGPHCDDEISRAQARYSDAYTLVSDRPYRIPGTRHDRRLVVYRRRDEPLYSRRAKAMQGRLVRIISSDQNPVFKDLKKTLTGRGIRKTGQALASGEKLVGEILSAHPGFCRGWVSRHDQPPPDATAHLPWYQLAPELLRELDIFGTHAPLLLIGLPESRPWNPSEGFPTGVSVIIPFQDPENVGAAIRSAAAFVGLVACSALVPTSTPTPLPSGMVDVGGYELFYQCSGQGNPTVILEAGSGTDSSTWSGVIEGVEGTTRVCAYDRAGLGRSDPAPRTYADMTGDLDTLLKSAQIEGPYILVGWSMGGDLVRLFASQHPEDVVGMVLVDSAHPDMARRLLASLPPETTDETEAIAYLRQWFTCMADSSGCLSEADTRASREQMKAVGPLGDLPLVVTTARGPRSSSGPARAKASRPIRPRTRSIPAATGASSASS